MRISIRWAMVLGCLGLIWGMQILITSSTYISSERMLAGHARDVMQNIADLTMIQSKNHLQLAQGAALLTKRLLASEVVSSDNQQHDVLERYFLNQLSLYAHFAGIYIGMPNGDFFYVNRSDAHTPGGFRTKVIDHLNGDKKIGFIWRNSDGNIVKTSEDPSDTYDPRQRPWYQKAVAKRAIIWTDPYIFFSSQKPGITVAGPIFKANGQLQSIVGVDIEIDDLSTFIGRLRIGKHGRAFMLNNNGDVVAFPDISKIKQGQGTAANSFRMVKIDELDDELSRAAFHAIQWQRTETGLLTLDHSQFAKFTCNGEVYNTMFTQFADSHWPWMIGVYIPENDYLGVLKENRSLNIWITLVLSVIATLMGLHLFRIITDRKKADLKLRRYQDQLEDLVKERTRDLQKSNEQLRTEIEIRKEKEEALRGSQARLHQIQRLEGIGTLAGGVAHDFNNLLMGIQGNISLMMLKTDPLAYNYNKLKSIESCIISGTKLTQQLLGFARGGKYMAKLLDLNRTVIDTARMFGRTRKEIQIQEDIARDLWAVVADKNQMEQVLLNIYINAWQAMPSGGTILIDAKNMVLDTSFSKAFDIRPGRYVCVSISDTGIGIDPSIQTRVFEPFFTTKEMGRGTGLGLASSYGIIKNHGGAIDFVSRPGNGTTFYIYLPASEADVEPESAMSDIISRGSETLLLIDDEEVILQVGQPMLESLGYKVMTAMDGKTAVEIFRQFSGEIALVILDVIMPGMSGGEIFDALKAINPRVQVLLASGYSLSGQAEEILSRGCVGFIQKPFSLEQLSVRLRDILDK
ncbi:ATP-binding protein [Desulfobacter postgatei]|uniref:histidine kinase n=1 Tax=Desulfobacter postgatei 2ac9 TaxID=879212 RepID=I5B3A1_9BACT|nr:ATP-binding protein [Desulfobacter postgatei]EIM63964.1 signal transduction histidine kinase regulating C4-dicarboxylate transport system [Desulfobacter postgatei 2ac9]